MLSNFFVYLDGQPFYAHPIPSFSFTDDPSIYVFARPCGIANFEPLYIGEAERFRQRLLNHEKLGPAIRMGATHILLAFAPIASERKERERQLIQTFKPPLNVQHNPIGALGIGARLLS